MSSDMEIVKSLRFPESYRGLDEKGIGARAEWTDPT